MPTNQKHLINHSLGIFRRQACIGLSTKTYQWCPCELHIPVQDDRLPVSSREYLPYELPPVLICPGWVLLAFTNPGWTATCFDISWMKIQLFEMSWKICYLVLPVLIKLPSCFTHVRWPATCFNLSWMHCLFLPVQDELPPAPLGRRPRRGLPKQFPWDDEVLGAPLQIAF